MATMRAARANFSGEKPELSIQDVEVPTPGAGEVLVKVKSAGVCLSDVHILSGDLKPPYLDGDEVTLESYAKVWSAGVSASSLGARIAEQVGIDPDRGGKIPVNEDLTVGDKDNVFIVGDVMSRDKLPGVAQVAIQSGVYAAQQIAKRAEGEDPKDREPFSYYDKGSMAIVSRFKAVAKIGDSELAGLVPWFMWLGVHLWYMSGRRSRFNALVSWVSNIFSRRREELTTTRQQVVGRTGLDKLAEEKPEEFEAIYSRKNK